MTVHFEPVRRGLTLPERPNTVTAGLDAARRSQLICEPRHSHVLTAGVLSSLRGHAGPFSPLPLPSSMGVMRLRAAGCAVGGLRQGCAAAAPLAFMAEAAASRGPAAAGA